MTILLEDVIKLLLAVLVGGVVGAEREFRDKAAGFGTIILICVGATLFSIFSLKLGSDRDPVRIAANIVSGVGFLGAGVILQAGGRILGITHGLHHLARRSVGHGHRWGALPAFQCSGWHHSNRPLDLPRLRKANWQHSTCANL